MITNHVETQGNTQQIVVLWLLSYLQHLGAYLSSTRYSGVLLWRDIGEKLQARWNANCSDIATENDRYGGALDEERYQNMTQKAMIPT